MTPTPVTPTALRDKARKAVDRNARDWAVGSTDRAVVDVPLHPPTEQQLRSGFDGATWVQEWRTAAAALPLDVVWVDRQWPTFGRQSVPDRVVITGASSIAEVAGEGQRWRSLSHRAGDLIARLLPYAADEEAVRAVVRSRLTTIGALPEVEAELLAGVIGWLAQNPVSGRAIRELPIRGIHSKWLERNRSLVESLVSSATGRNGLGLRAPTDVARIRLLDPDAQSLGLSDITAPVAELAALALVPRRIIVIENLQTFLSLPETEGTIAYYGGGNQAAILGRTLGSLPWHEAAAISYWGDIDSHGFRILSQARASGVALSSVLMDADTLLAFRDLAVPEPAPFTGTTPFLTDSERATLAVLRDEGNLRLEQERIPWGYALERWGRAF